VQLGEEEVEADEEMVQLAELVVVVVVVAWAMEQGSEEHDGPDGEFEQPLEAMQLPMLPTYLDVDCLVEELEELLAEEEVEEVVQLAALVVVVAVAQAKEQGSEERDGPDGEGDQPLEAMQLDDRILEVQLPEKEVVGEPDVDIVE